MWKVYPKWTNLLLSITVRIAAYYKRNFFKRQHKLYLIFFTFQFFKVGKFATFSERPKAKSVSASEASLTP